MSASETLKTAAERSGCSAEELTRFSTHLHALPQYQAARINPFAFAEAAGISAERALDVFIHGAKLGLFDLEWGMVCPLCGAITHSASDIDAVDKDAVHCALCNRDEAVVLDDTIEVSFAYSPTGSAMNLHDNFTAYQHYYTSSSYPYLEQWRTYHEQHTVADIKLEPGEEATVNAHLQPGETYRLLCMDVHSSADIKVVEDAAAPANASQIELSLSDKGFAPAEVTISEPDVSLTVANRTEQTVWCRLLHLYYTDVHKILQLGPPQFGQRLTGKHLLNNQAFRDNFALHELSPDLKLKLRSLTLLFTDLKGSTALYDREGDLAAYRLVQEHFAALKQIVRSHSGAMIKTMGDAVMAAFPSGGNGTAAAISMMAAMQELTDGRQDDEVGLKVGLHTGPALAINAGSSLDYFGQTVNIAARVQGLADAGDICLTGALNDNNEVPDLLGRAGYIGSPEMARLKGVSTEERVFRYRTAG